MTELVEIYTVIVLAGTWPGVLPMTYTQITFVGTIFDYILKPNDLTLKYGGN